MVIIRRKEEVSVKKKIGKRNAMIAVEKKSGTRRLRRFSRKKLRTGWQKMSKVLSTHLTKWKIMCLVYTITTFSLIFKLVARSITKRKHQMCVLVCGQFNEYRKFSAGHTSPIIDVWVYVKFGQFFLKLKKMWVKSKCPSTVVSLTAIIPMST